MLSAEMGRLADKLVPAPPKDGVWSANMRRRAGRRAGQGRGTSYAGGILSEPQTDPYDAIMAALEPDPAWDYATVLPFATHRETGEIDWAVPTMAREVAREVTEGVAAPRRVLEGKTTPEEGAFDTALMLLGETGFGSMLVPEGALGMFAGKMAKNAPLDDLARAEKMLDGGADMADVWRDTGWFKGPEGKWRWEIDDSGSVLTERGLGETAFDHLDDVFDHSRLGDSYPDTGGILTEIDSTRPGGLKGEYQPREAREHLGLFDLDEQVSVYSLPSKRKKTLLHELQHAVQEREGFARGGKPEPIDLTTFRPQITERTKQLMDERGLPMGDAMAIAEQEARFRGYQNLAGEIEARDVSARMDLTPEQRRETLPALLLADDPIVRMDGDGPAMSLPDDYASRMARAREMGFDVDTPLYHGTDKDFAEFVPSDRTGELGSYFGSPDMANDFARGAGGRLVPVYGRANNPLDLTELGGWVHDDNLGDLVRALDGVVPQQDISEAYKKAYRARAGDVPVFAVLEHPNVARGIRESGAFDAVDFMDLRNGSVEWNRAVIDPSNIRSRFAMFDPAKKDSANILAGVGAAGLLGLGASPDFYMDEY